MANRTHAELALLNEEVLALRGQLPTREIAARLGVSVACVDRTLRRLRERDLLESVRHISPVAVSSRPPTY